MSGSDSQSAGDVRVQVRRIMDEEGKMSWVPLLDADTCVVCFHDAHPQTGCMEIDFGGGPIEGDGWICGCDEYVTDEDRGRIVVTSGYPFSIIA